MDRQIVQMDAYFLLFVHFHNFLQKLYELPSIDGSIEFHDTIDPSIIRYSCNNSHSFLVERLFFNLNVIIFPTKCLGFLGPIRKYYFVNMYNFDTIYLIFSHSFDDMLQLNLVLSNFFRSMLLEIFDISLLDAMNFVL